MLYIVSTPIGNLSDITLRAIETLKKVDFIACEDTRHTRILLNHYDIKTPMISYHQHSKPVRAEKILSLLDEGKDIVLVSDAGTPGISDPGQKLISDAIDSKIILTVIPGPTAALAALSLSGFASDSYVYLGFLPNKKGRQKKLTEIAQEKRTIILYESVYRIKKLLIQLAEFIPERRLCVARELTKKFEELYRGRAEEILKEVKEKGEFVVVIEGERNG